MRKWLTAASLSLAPLHVCSPPQLCLHAQLWSSSLLLEHSSAEYNDWSIHECKGKRAKFLLSVRDLTDCLASWVSGRWLGLLVGLTQAGMSSVVLLECLGSNWLEAKKDKTARAGCRSSAGTHVALGKGSFLSRKKGEKKRKEKHCQVSPFKL